MVSLIGVVLGMAAAVFCNGMAKKIGSLAAMGLWFLLVLAIVCCMKYLIGE